jgi:dihydrofolate reductase
MGRKTYESFAKFNKDGIAKPLPNRTNVVITRDTNWQADDVLVFSSPEAVLEHFKDTGTLWVVGGGEIYRQFLKYADELHITHVEVSTEADTFFPEFDSNRYKPTTKIEIQKNEANSHNSTYCKYVKSDILQNSYA